MLALILVTVFLHLNLICNGQEAYDKNAQEFDDISASAEGSRQIREVEVLAGETIVAPETTPPNDEAPLDGLIAPPHKVNVAQDDVGALWPLGVIPYYFDAESYDHLIATRFQEALNDVESSSCIKFRALVVKPTENGSWIHITNPNRERACVHEPLIKETGEIELVLGFDCLKRREVLHTLLHAIGFNDEVCHPQRDQYIRVLWENIQPEYRKLFRVQFDTETLAEYDPASIMHFHDRAFTMNGQATIAPLMSGLLIHPSNELSPLDKMKLRVLFGRECNRRKVGDLLDTCKNVLHKDHNEEQAGETTKRPTDTSSGVSCRPGALGCMPPVHLIEEFEKKPLIVHDKDGPISEEQELVNEKTQDLVTYGGVQLKRPTYRPAGVSCRPGALGCMPPVHLIEEFEKRPLIVHDKDGPISEEQELVNEKTQDLVTYGGVQLKRPTYRPAGISCRPGALGCMPPVHLIEEFEKRPLIVHDKDGPISEEQELVSEKTQDQANYGGVK